MTPGGRPEWALPGGTLVGMNNGLSEPSLGMLVKAGQRITGTDLKTLLLKAGIFYRDTEDPNKPELIRWRLLRARDNANDGDEAALRGMLKFATEVVQRTVPNPEDPPPWFGELRDALLADGYELTWEGAPPRTIGTSFLARGNIRYKILPTDPAPVPLPRQITALEAELAARGYTIALNHYQQAVDGLTHGKYESANGDLRAALEDLVTCLAEDHTGYTRLPRANQGGAAINHMVTGGHLVEDDGGLLLRGLWKVSPPTGRTPASPTPTKPGSGCRSSPPWRASSSTASRQRRPDRAGHPLQSRHGPCVDAAEADRVPRPGQQLSPDTAGGQQPVWRGSQQGPSSP